MTSLSSSNTPPSTVCSNDDDDALLAADLALLSLRDALDSSPLQPALPFDVLTLIVSEADRADLPAWCLVSSAFARIARPLLWREVSFADGAVMLRVLLALCQSDVQPVSLSAVWRSAVRVPDLDRLTQQPLDSTSLFQHTVFLSLPSLIKRSSFVLLHHLFAFRRSEAELGPHLTVHVADRGLVSLATAWYITRPELFIVDLGQCGCSTRSSPASTLR